MSLSRRITAPWASAVKGESQAIDGTRNNTRGLVRYHRYSGSDIAVVVRDALMQPVRKVLSATHFKQVDVDGVVKWTPCSPGDPEAVERAWTDIGTDELLEPPLRLVDFERALSDARPTVTEEDIKKHSQWTNDAGKSMHNKPVVPGLNGCSRQ